MQIFPKRGPGGPSWKYAGASCPPPPKEGGSRQKGPGLAPPVRDGPEQEGELPGLRKGVEGAAVEEVGPRGVWRRGIHL